MAGSSDGAHGAKLARLEEKVTASAAPAGTEMRTEMLRQLVFLQSHPKNSLHGPHFLWPQAFYDLPSSFSACFSSLHKEQSAH